MRRRYRTKRWRVNTRELSGWLGGGGGGGYARRAKRRRRAYFGFLSKIPRRGHVNCITIKRPRFPRNKIWRWRLGPKGHDEAAGRLGSRAAGLVVVEEPIRYRERESWLLPHSGRPIADWPPSSSSLLLLLLLFLRSIKIRRKFLFFFFFFTMLIAKLLSCWITWVIPCMANSPAMSPPRCRLLKHSINKADSGHATELFSSRSPCLLTQHGQG